MPGEEQRREPEQARTILQYFVRHPEAADSFEGIVTFRLLEATVQRHVEEVRDALKWLVNQGFLEAVPTRGSSTKPSSTEPSQPDMIFSLNRSRRLEAERFLVQPRLGKAANAERRECTDASDSDTQARRDGKES